MSARRVVLLAAALLAAAPLAGAAQPARTAGADTATAIRLETVEVRTRALGAGEAIQPASVLDAERIAERMAASVGAVIAAEPGVTVRTNGPMATLPVIRGLTGDRVLVLEDGMRTGDIATTAPDHAVTIEPATARSIEVIRGPAGLLYGSNTLGGVVNVVRDAVPRERPSALHWGASAYGESANRGAGGALHATGSTGPVAWRADLSGRTAGDTRTPRGHLLPSTDLRAFDGGAGASWVTEHGHAGAAVREYRARYGVPGSFRGVVLPGAHAGGVYVEARRTRARMDAEWRGSGAVEALSLGAGAVRFEQTEYEAGGLVGTRFGQLSAGGEAVARFAAGRHRGAVGASLHWRDLRAEGSYTGTRPATQRAVALFAVDELRLGRTVLLAGLRVDGVRTVPLDSTETLLLRDVRTRELASLTGAAGIRFPLGGGWTAAVQAARAFRPPSIEELYSAGPHLASYAYEVGDPTLEAERGTGVDAVLRREGPRGRLEVAAYAMRVDGYVAFLPQLDPSTGLPLRDPRLRRYVVYRPVQEDARLYGVEARAALTPTPGWRVELSGDLPRGARADGTPLPSMPPATARLEVRRSAGRAALGVVVDGRMAQRRVPPPPPGEATCQVEVVDGEARALPAEHCPTPGVALLGVLASLRLPAVGGVRAPALLTLSVDNLLDARWRDPLWRAGLVAPQPGRNVRLGVRVEP